MTVKVDVLRSIMASRIARIEALGVSGGSALMRFVHISLLLCSI